MRICVGIDAAKSIHWALGVDEGGREAIDGFMAALRGL
ncbi:hypothetical protein SAMCCGM7_pC1334 (plasmid) [Sinorhizobium americanum CCGM7]|uniref:Transposase n=1 Tax=Sinorhizobium americanum TaxID=194963 RepID=A0A4R2BZ22_9HYPH|nr:hypothetical protein SAMCCGM7_pC1334 [Sinorhizobium americanum CCGM7]TCN31294.1 hypothetical protein EV184_10666 [Sinorhizobium americanum]